MQPLAVDPRILRVLLGPDIKVVPGRAMMARVVVAAAGNGRGSLSIAGYIVEAELPKDMRTGEDLRLVVRDVSPERVLLAVSEEHQPAAEPPPATPATPPSPAIPLPGGASVQVTERDAGSAAAGSAESQSLTLRYDAPTVGPVELRFQLDPSSLRLGVTVAPGDSLELARADADSLRQGLTDELGRAVSVTVSPRREPLDIYA